MLPNIKKVENAEGQIAIFFLWKKETPPHVFTTRLRHRITPWGESERPRGRTTGKYVKNILLAYFSLLL